MLDLPEIDTSRRPSASGRRRAEGAVRFSGSRRDQKSAEASHATAKPSRSAKQKQPSRRPSFARRFINHWFFRLAGVVGDRNLADQAEEYEAGRTSKDFIWNAIGQATWGMVFPILTIVVTQLSGADLAGMFSFAFVIANLLYIVGTYGIRTFQVSDLDEYHSFMDYQINRYITCAIMLALGVLVLEFVGYTGAASTMALGVFAFKTIDALAEVYEGRLQQCDKLYLAGISATIRSVTSFAAFALALFLTKDLAISGIAMAVAASASFIIVTFPLAIMETQRSRPATAHSVKLLFKSCFPVFCALFLYALIDNMPKFVMQGADLPYFNQLYFNALYFPAMAVLIVVQLIYKPLLVSMAQLWAEKARRRRFDLIILAMFALIVVITFLTSIFMLWLGVPIMSFMYGIDFEPYRQLAVIMIAAGGVTAGIDFLYQIITILRRQNTVLSLYLIVFGFSLLVLILMVTMMELEGAVVGYLLVMTILLILLVREYALQRIDYSRMSES